MAWQRTKPAASADLESAPVRGNFQELELSNLGNCMPDPYHLIWPAGDAAAPAGWTLAGSGGAVARITSAGNHLGGNMAVQLTLGAANTTLTRTLIPAGSFPTELQGKDVSIGVAIKTATASLAGVRIYDGVTMHEHATTPYHTGGGSFEWLWVTATLDASATELSVVYYLDIGASSGNAVFDLPTFVLGGIAPQRFLPPRINEGVLVYPVVGDVATETDKFHFLAGLPFIIRNVTVRCKTAPTDASLIVDVNHWDGSAFQSMFSTRPTLATTEKNNGANPDGTYRYRCFDGMKDDDSVTDCLLGVDIDQVGSTLPGFGYGDSYPHLAIRGTASSIRSIRLMAVQILQADVDGPNTDLTYDGSTDIAVVMGTEDDSDETDRLRGASLAGDEPDHDWYLDALNGGAQSVDQVDTRFFVRSNGGDRVASYLHDGVTRLLINDSAIDTGSVGSYTHVDDSNVDHPTLGPGGWAPGDFPGGGAGTYQGVYSSTNAGGSIFATYAHVQVTFTLGGGGFALWVSGLIPPLIGLASHGLLRKEIAAMCRMMKVRPTYAQEFERIRSELLRRPRFA